MSQKIFIPQYVISILECFYNAGFQAFLVGGCVRDSLLNKIPYDYDISTDALPEEIKSCLKSYKTIDTGIQHGTVTAVSDGHNVEITTFRTENGYTDNRHPDSVSFTNSLKEDLSRRDFTINAMAYSPQEGIIDYYNGLFDLKNGIIKAVGNPRLRFEEDALRIIRALRFSSVLNFEIEKQTSDALSECKELLQNISKERLQSELVKLLMGDNVYPVLMEYHSVFEVFIPEITACIGFNQHNKYHRFDVWEHIAYSVGISKKSKIIRLTMFLHDIAKPQCFTMDEKGQGHFKGHEGLSATMAEDILKRLRFDNETIKRVCLLISLHYFVPSVDDKGNPSQKQIKRLLNKTGNDAFFELLDVQRADNSAKQEFCTERLPILNKMEALAKDMIAKSECFSLKNLKVNGNDLIELGISGKEIGETLAFLLNKVIDGELENCKSNLLKCVIDKKNEN